jgi:hypothetical protein
MHCQSSLFHFLLTANLDILSDLAHIQATKVVMCIASFFTAHPEYFLVFLSNRDEPHGAKHMFRPHLIRPHRLTDKPLRRR